jgi:hypothetical protein
MKSAEYQETACRCAKVLNLPLLNLNELLLEVAAFAEVQHAKDFAKQIDNRYKEVTAKFSAMSAKKNLLSFQNKSQLSSKQMPTAEDFEKIDPYSLYEHKVEMITYHLSDLEFTDSLISFKAKGKAGLKNKDITSRKKFTLPNVSEELFREVFRERYIVQLYFLII